MTNNTENNLSKFHSSYVLRTIDPDFSKGHRQLFRYATTTHKIHLDKLNPKGPEPFNYLNYAKADLLLNDTRGSINALGNTKRAVHITVEKLLWVFGLYKAYSKSNFPEKLGIISELEVFPIGIIQILNKERNYVEHEYTSIASEEVKKFIDITELLLLVSYPFLRSAVTGAVIGIDESDECYEWVLDVEKSIVTKHLIKHDKFVSTKIGTIHYNFDTDKPTEQIEQIKITKENKDKWLPVLNLFAYLTKNGALKLSSENDSYGYSVSKVWHLICDDPICINEKEN